MGSPTRPCAKPDAIRKQTSTAMKTRVALALAAVLFVTACSGGGGPVTRTGRAVDNAVAGVGRGVERTGEVIQDTARGN